MSNQVPATSQNTFALLIFAVVTVAIAVFLIGTSNHSASVSTDDQTSTGDTVAPQQSIDAETVVINCEPVALANLQAQLDSQLTNFAQAYENGDESALQALYIAGTLYQEMALTCGYIPDNVSELVINTTGVERILTVLATLQGDPVNGQLLYNGIETSASGDILGCSGCHSNETVAPTTEGTWTRWDEQRTLEAQFADRSFAYYATHSIILPWDYFVAGYPEYTMPDFFHSQLGYQDLADIIAYLEGQDQLLEQ